MNEQLRREITERKRAEGDLQALTHDLRKSVRELDCLYGISKLVEAPNISLEEILQGSVALLPPSWQYPDIARAKIVLGNVCRKPLSV